MDLIVNSLPPRNHFILWSEKMRDIYSLIFKLIINKCFMHHAFSLFESFHLMSRTCSLSKNNRKIIIDQRKKQSAMRHFRISLLIYNLKKKLLYSKNRDETIKISVWEMYINCTKYLPILINYHRLDTFTNRSSLKLINCANE